jgi:epoxyqueuosine reductase
MRTGLKLEDCLREHGLFVRGVTQLNEEEIERFGINPETAGLALIGNIGSSYWEQFSQSAEFKDGAAHPLDRWSRRVAEPIAQRLSLRALYPFEGPP